MIHARIQINGLVFSHVGWKYYNSIKKKAMEQEFSWAGLIISLSIAFFIVVFFASIFSFAYRSMESSQNRQNLFKAKIYQLEMVNYTPVNTVNV